MGLETAIGGAMMGADIIGGAAQANSAKKAQQAQYKKMNAIFEQLSPEIRGLYDDAFKLAGNYGKTSMRQAEQASASSLAAAREDSISRGLHNTTYFDAMRRGVNSDLMGAKSAINEQTAMMLSNILQGKAGAIGNLGMGHAQALSQYQMAPGQGPGLSNWAKAFWPNGIG